MPRLTARSTTKVLLAAMLGFAVSAPLSEAKDRREGFRSDRHDDRDNRRDRKRHRPAPIQGGNGLPSVVPGVGTYAGDISAVRQRGNGIYFSIRGRTPGSAIEVNRTRVITVTPDTRNDACNWENGVCVVRP